MSVNYVRRLGGQFSDLSGILERGKLNSYRGESDGEVDLILIDRGEFYSAVLVDVSVSQFLFGQGIPVKYPSTDDVSGKLQEVDYERLKDFELFRVENTEDFGIGEVEAVNIFEEEKGRAGDVKYSELVARFIVKKADGTSYYDYKKFEPWYDSIEDLVLK